MTTTEKLFVQIFDRKNRIIEQVKQRTDLYRQHLASKILLDGYDPPLWLWNPNFNSRSSDPQGDRPTSLPNCHDNNLHDAVNYDPELSNGAASPQGQTEVRTVMTYTAPDQSLARLQRSKSRQKALEIRNSAKTAAKSRYAPDETGVVSHDKLTFSNTSGKSLMKLSLEPNASNNKTEAWGVPSETCVDECVGHNEDVSNNLTYAADKSNSVIEIQHSHVSDGPDILLSNAGNGFDEKYMVQVQEDELGFEKGNPGSDATSAFKNGQLGTSILSGFMNDTTEGFQDCSSENVETADTTRIYLDGRMPGDELHYINKLHSGNDVALENEDDLTRSERMVQETEPHFEVSFSHSSIVSPEDKHPDSLDADETMPEFEGFIIGSEEDGGPDIAGDGFGLDKLDLPSAAIERASILEQLCRSPSMHDTTEGFQDCSSENVETEDTTRIYLDGRMPGDELHYINKLHSGNDVALENEDDLTRSERMVQETEPHFEVSFSHSSIVCPEDKHLDSLDADETMPEFEGFIIGSEEDGGPDIAGDGFSLDKLDLPSAAIERASILEQLCRSPSMHDTTQGFQDCSSENVETADTTHIYLDGRMPGDELHYINKLHSGNDVALENEDDLTRSERMVQETEPHFEISFSHSPIVSPEDKHLDSLDADETMPEFKGFIIGSEEDGGPDIAGDGFSLDKLDLPSAAIERASILEQLCRSASMHTPLPKFSTAFKFHRTPGVYQSVPNGLLEHTDLRSTFILDDGGKQLRASYSNVGEVKSGFQGSSLSGGVPYSDPPFKWSLKEHPMSPVGNPWDWFSVNSSSSEKERSSNPELTCFPIEEDPSNSEENENGDEEADTIQEDACSTLLNSGAEREPLAELKVHANPPTSVSAVEEFPDRSMLDSTDSEVSVTEAHSKVRQPTGNCNNNKRRCTNEANENSHFSVGTNNDTKATKSRTSRFSKPKLVGKASLRKDMHGLLEREPKHNNIVANVTSFVPFVQQKQEAAVATGKRSIKVKALEAAKAAKHLEAKKDNERKMKKEALKLERAKTEQENLRQMELKMKMKQEEQKKKDADVAARKRLREEEERKEKERKRQRTDMRRQLRDQGDTLPNRKVEKEVKISTADKKSDEELRKVQKMGNKQGDDNVGKKQEELGASEVLASNLRQAALKDCETSPRCVDTREPTSVLSKPTESNDLVEKTSLEKSYEISPYQCSDDEDEEDEIPTTKYIPSWASKTSVALVLSSQQNIDPDVIFPPETFCSSDEVLQRRKLQLK